MSLTTSIQKAGKDLPHADRAAIFSSARQHRQAGLSPDAAAMRAVQDQLAAVQAELAQALKDAPPEPAKPMTSEVQSDGTLAIRGDPEDIRTMLAAAGITKTMSTPGGVLVGKTEAEQAQAALAELENTQEDA